MLCHMQWSPSQNKGLDPWKGAGGNLYCANKSMWTATMIIVVKKW